MQLNHSIIIVLNSPVLSQYLQAYTTNQNLLVAMVLVRTGVFWER